MQVIYSSWIISGEEGKSPTAIPTGPGVFDYALSDLVKRGMFPEWVRDRLHFVESASGLTCLEAEQIQKLATEGKMTSDPNPAYVRSDIQVTKKGTDYSLETFRPLLDGTTNWPAVTEALGKAGYRGFLTFEYFHPYAHYPEALIYHTSDSLDRILGRKT